MFHIKKWLLILVALVIIGFVGYKFGMDYMGNKIMDQVADQVITPEEINKLKQDPEVKKIVEQNFTPEQVKKIYSEVQASSSPTADIPVAASSSKEVKTETKTNVTAEPTAKKVMSKDEASKMLLSKFSMNEIKSMAAKASNGLTSDEKNEIKQKLMTRLSDQELQKLKLAALVEIMKRDAK